MWRNGKKKKQKKEKEKEREGIGEGGGKKEKEKKPRSPDSGAVMRASELSGLYFAGEEEAVARGREDARGMEEEARVSDGILPLGGNGKEVGA